MRSHFTEDSHEGKHGKIFTVLQEVSFILESNCMKRAAILSVILFYTLSAYAQNEARSGIVKKITGNDIIVKYDSSVHPFAVGKKLHIRLDDNVINIEVIFPMQTLAKCRLEKKQDNISRIKEGMIVYEGKALEHLDSIAEKKEPPHDINFTFVSKGQYGKYSSWNENLKFNSPGNGIILFSASARNDIHIALSDELCTKKPMYEIVVGGWSNTRSVIRKESQGYIYKTSEKHINTYSAQKYWIKLDSSVQTISVGYGDIPGEDTIIEWTDPKFLLNVQYFAFSSWDSDISYSDIIISSLK